ncbi:MAG: NblA/ycf18 family protein [Synechococcales bacterium]|nr:NblA/ycf18 family protein [Synechococcales bacterium]
MDKSIELSLEQQFSLRSFETSVAHMSHEQAQEFLVKLYEQMLMKDAMFRYLLKERWDIGNFSGL